MNSVTAFVKVVNEEELRNLKWGMAHPDLRIVPITHARPVGTTGRYAVVMPALIPLKELWARSPPSEADIQALLAVRSCMMLAASAPISPLIILHTVSFIVYR